MTPRVLFVCLGNICRSPLAEGVFRHLAAERGIDVEVDSAGTGAWHAGESPDPRSCEVAARHGIDLDGQRARAVVDADFERFDRIVAMDQQNLEDLKRRCPPGSTARIERLRDHDPQGPGDVPDPYYGVDDGFERVYAMIRRSCEALLDSWEADA